MSKPNRPKWQTITFWILSVGLGLMFLGAGAAKLAGAEEMVQNFARWGLPDWFRPIVGVTEIVAAVALIVPRSRFYGAALLVSTMIGATLTHVITGVDMQMIGGTIMFGSVAALIAWPHRPDFIRQRLAGDAAA